MTSPAMLNNNNPNLPRGADRDDPKAVEIIERAIREIPTSGRNRPAYEIGQTLGCRLDRLTESTTSRLIADIEGHVGDQRNVDAFMRGVHDGSAHPYAGGGTGTQPRAALPRPAAPKSATPDAKKKAEGAKRALAASIDINDPRAELGRRYFTEIRAVSIPDGAQIRFRPKGKVLLKGSDRKAAGILYPFHDLLTGALIEGAIAVQYLNDDGTKAIDIATKGKHSLGARGSAAAIILGDLASSDTLIVAEGPETALSGVEAVGFPAVARYGVSYGTMPIPPGIKRLLVLADHKASESADAQIAELRQRHPHVRVIVARTPDPKHDDFNDLHRAEGLDAVRAALDAMLVDADLADDAANTDEDEMPLDAAPTHVHAQFPIDDLPDNIGKRRSQANIRAFLRWRVGGLRYNAFALRTEVDLDGVVCEVSDAITRRLWLEADKLGIVSDLTFFQNVLLDEARDTVVHPVRDYLDGLVWDGVPRVGQWLSRYLGAEDTPLTREMGRLWLMAAVRRVREPGVKFDQCLVLEGPQGAGKSSAFAVLGGSWFSDNLHVGAESKVVIELTSGKWVVELAELNGLRNSAVEATKAMISRQTDRARLAFEKAALDVPRQFILGASVNEERYLRDSTGNRRFWPVRVGSVDLEALAHDRDQIWAEAAHLAATGATLTLGREHWQNAAVEQEQRRISDPWKDRLSDRLVDHRGYVTTSAVWKFLEIRGDRQDGNQGQRLAAVMRQLGFENRQIRVEGRQVYCFTNVPKGDPKGDRLDPFL